MKKRKYLRSRKQFLEKSIEDLLDLLGSEDLRTRFLAEMTLRDISGT